MATKLDKFSESYAALTTAVYEPLIIRWVSGWTLHCLSNQLAWRAQKGKSLKLDPNSVTALQINKAIPRMERPLPPKGAGPIKMDSTLSIVDKVGGVYAREFARSISEVGASDAHQVGDDFYAKDVLRVQKAAPKQNVGLFARLFGRGVDEGSSGRSASNYFGVKTVPSAVNPRLGGVDSDFNFRSVRDQISKTLFDNAKKSVLDKSSMGKALHDSLATEIHNLPIFDFFPRNIEEALSPIGVVHYYRQLFFNTEEGVGPIEQAFTIAPLETLELVYETTRRQVQEEVMEVGEESISETAREIKNLDEVSDKVSSMLQRDTSASMSTTGSYSTPVWQVGASASVDMSTSRKRGREYSSRQVKEVTQRASEIMKKSFTLKTRDLHEITTSELTRRVIKNESDRPVSYGLRRVLRRVRVKVQDLGPRLVWQTYLRDPGEGLARSKFVHFRESEQFAPPDIPPGLPPRPTGDIDGGSTTSSVPYNHSRDTHYVTLEIKTTSDRVIRSASIDSITDLEDQTKDDWAPSPRSDIDSWGTSWDEDTRTFTVNIPILRGDADSVAVEYSYTWEPSQKIIDEWESKRALAVEELKEEAMVKQFEKRKSMITEVSKIRPRPANDLRREERFEVMNRMVSHLFARGDDPSEPTPLEIEFFHRYFDLERMFIYTHPSWWKPRRSRSKGSFGRTPYEITADSDPAPLGSSLGWLLQLDGDSRRNEFLNSPWVRVCMPLKPGVEREAVEWLKEHIEGDIGYDLDAEPLKSLLEDVKARRDQEEALGHDGPNYVKVDSTVGAPEDPLRPEHVYPIVDEFDVTVPTEGFVYDELKVQLSETD